jgi:hypothetical protein
MCTIHSVPACLNQNTPAHNKLQKAHLLQIGSKGQQEPKIHIEPVSEFWAASQGRYSTDYCMPHLCLAEDPAEQSLWVLNPRVTCLIQLKGDWNRAQAALPAPQLPQDAVHPEHSTVTLENYKPEMKENWPPKELPCKVGLFIV